MGLIDKLAFWRQKDIVKPPDPERSGPNVFWTGDEAGYLNGDSDDGESFVRNGVLITPDIAFQASAVWACIDVQAKAIAASDWLVIEQETPKKHTVLYDDDLTYILNTRPNMDMTAFAFRRAMVIAALSWGNAYANITRNLAGRVQSLYPIHPERVRPIRTGEGEGELAFVVRNDDGSQTVIMERDIYRMRGASILGLLGVNKIGQAAGSIALAMATQEFAQAFFQNGGRPGGVVEYAGEIDDPTYDRLSKQWNARHGGPRKAFKTAFLDQGLKYTPIVNDGNKTEMIDSRKQDILDIARWWGVPPHLIQMMDNSTFSNIEHQGIEFVKTCLRPLAREMEQEANFKLFSARMNKRRTRIDLDWMAEGDFKSRVDGLNVLRDDGVLNANEIREELGWTNMGAIGDKYLVQGAMIDLVDVGLPYKNKMKPPAKKGGAPEKDDDEDMPDTAMARAWARSVISSCVRFKRGRARDLLKSMEKDAAEAKASAEISAHITAQSSDFVVNMSAGFGRDTTALIVSVCKEAANTGDVEGAVDNLFDSLRASV